MLQGTVPYSCMHGQQKLDLVGGKNQIKGEAMKLGGGLREDGWILEDMWGRMNVIKIASYA